MTPGAGLGPVVPRAARSWSGPGGFHCRSKVLWAHLSPEHVSVGP